MSRLGTLFSRTADGVFVSDVNTHRIVYWNHAAQSIFGRPSSNVCGKFCHDVVRGMSRDGTPFCGPDCPVKWAARSGRVVRHFDLITHAASGRKIRLDVSILVVWAGPGRKLRVVHLFRKKTASILRPPRPAGSPGARIRLAPADGEILIALTRRERDVLDHMADGLSTRALAARLGIRYLTARTHIQRILSKLGVHTRVEAVLLAIRRPRAPGG
ncbi:MAG: hypothetical protein A3G34_11410 [Candidatus Lindowbacteria bacterium RIFCSPLOWO2_12_FULL_62_27]|nr:MAG: hypothetical protein A3I06_16320 [Candidatus Lindowbacteria bacterium RIFCSPLOWO2_02_FULL_62_12]OGH60719.1 MAG: hypothetical protein A3G34_11410 [Candidatus Lindowbacteria bacterium RIFCSPLOWO2_12_FULL_62_27]